MERFRRVSQLWNWLPAFRGVAEHESIHKAAATLGMSPSALSRTVKLLEDNLGEPLFTRHVTGLRLTPLGSDLLSYTRAAMRLIDDGIDSERGHLDHTRPIEVGATSDLAAVVVGRALAGHIDAGARIHIVRVVGDVSQQLVLGNLDAVVTAVAAASVELVCESLAPARSGIYAALDHPLATRAGQLGADELAIAEFVMPTAEPWSTIPPPGAVRVTCDTVEIARVVCESAGLLAVLPDAAVVGAAAALVRIADAHETPLYLLRRRTVVGTDDNPALVRLVIALREPG